MKSVKGYLRNHTSKGENEKCKMLFLEITQLQSPSTRKVYCVSVPKYEYDYKDDVLSLSVDDDDEYQCENDGWSTFFFLDDDIT